MVVRPLLSVLLVANFSAAMPAADISTGLRDRWSSDAGTDIVVPSLF